MPQKKRTNASNANRDPISGEPGSHPVGVGVGTAAGGLAAGAAGAVAGPVGAAVGAVAGGLAGGVAGKAVAEAVDPTAEDAYWREHYHCRPYVEEGAEYDQYRPAYLYGVGSQAKYPGRGFEEAEPELRKGWTKARGESALTWTKARDAVRDAYDRTIQLREEELRAHKVPVQRGEVRVRKDVVTEQRTLDVPVEREEVVVERRPVSRRRASNADFRAEEVTVPVQEERVRVEKVPVVKEEVTVGKRKTRGTEKVAGTVRKEKLRVDKEGSAKVQNAKGRK